MYVFWGKRIPLYQSNHLAQDEEPASLPLPPICLEGMMARVSLGLHKHWNSPGRFISFIIGPLALCSQSDTSLHLLQMALNWSRRKWELCKFSYDGERQSWTKEGLWYRRIRCLSAAARPKSHKGIWAHMKRLTLPNVVVITGQSYYKTKK